MLKFLETNFSRYEATLCVNMENKVSIICSFRFDSRTWNASLGSREKHLTPISHWVKQSTRCGVGGTTRPLPRDGGAEELRGDPTIGPWSILLHQRPATSSWWCSFLPNGDGSKWQDRSPEGLDQKVTPMLWTRCSGPAWRQTCWQNLKKGALRWCGWTDAECLLVYTHGWMNHLL